MGRHARPTHLKVLAGERPSRINDAEPVPAQGAVDPPEWLDGVGLEVWNELSPDLISKQVLTPWDAIAFAMACDSVRLYRACREQVEADGYLLPGAKGGVVKHPLLMVMRDASASFASLGSRFGLTPSDRARLTVGAPIDPLGPERFLT